MVTVAYDVCSGPVVTVTIMLAGGGASGGSSGGSSGGGSSGSGSGAVVYASQPVTSSPVVIYSTRVKSRGPCTLSRVS